MRQAVTNLAHSRPFDRAPIPSIVSAITTTSKQPEVVDGVSCPLSFDDGASLQNGQAEYDHLAALCKHFMVEPPPADSSFFMADLAGTCSLRWERHTEVQTYTFSRAATAEEATSPFSSSSLPLSVLPEWWTASLPGTVVASTHYALIEHAPTLSFNSLVAREQRFAWIANQFGRSSMITAASVDSSRFRVYSDWRVHADGFGRMMVVSDMPPEASNKRSSAGKVLQRLIELDKYRMLALMGLPFARALVPRIDELNAELTSVMAAVGHAGQLDVTEQRRVLDQLSELTAASLKLGSSSHFRFSASAAYSQIVDDRIKFLGMETIDGIPSIHVFVQGTSHPAMRTCESVVRRLEALSASSQLAADLLRTSLNVQQQADNIKRLGQIQRNARSQLLLQESAEGLGVVAITYYSTGVLGYVAKAVDKLGYLPVPPELALGASVPLVALAVYISLNRLKQHVHGH